MAGVTTLAVVGLALVAVGTAGQFVASQRQGKLAKKSAKEQQRLAALEARRARRRTIREARIARGQALNVASAIGAAGGSGLAGGLSGIASQTGANLGFSLQTENIGQRLTSLSIKSAKAGQLGAISEGVANIGGALFSSGLGRQPRPSAAPLTSPIPVARPF